MAAPSDLTPVEQAQMDLGITPVVSAVDVAVGEVGAEIALGAAKEALAAAGVNAVEAGTGSAAAARQRSRGRERRTRTDSSLKKGRGGSAAETNNNKSIHKNTSKSKQLQRHNRESSSSALPLAIISGIAAKPTSDQQRQCMCACSNPLERHCRWPFMATITMPLRWPNQPLRLTIRMPNQGVAKLTPVPPS